MYVVVMGQHQKLYSFSDVRSMLVLYRADSVTVSVVFDR